MQRVEYQCKTMDEYHKAMDAWRIAVATNPEAPLPLPPEGGLEHEAIQQFNKMFHSL